MDKAARRDAPVTMLAVRMCLLDYGRWRTAFDTCDEDRSAAGIKRVRIYRNSEDQNDVLMWCEVVDIAKAEKSIMSEATAQSMRGAGVAALHVMQVVANASCFPESTAAD